MPLPVFSGAWAAACADLLSRSTAYRAAATTWEGAILLLMLPDDGTREERRVFLDLWHGDCRSARAAERSDEAFARYVLAGTESAWRLVLTGRAAPLLAIMTGKLKLTKGSLAELVPFAVAARELVAAAAAIDASFPGEG